MVEARRFYTLDVFTHTAFGGNALAVIPDANGLSDSEMQSIAFEFNLSETVFVLPARDPSNACALRIFTPRVELPFAGHPSIGAAHLLASLGRLPSEPEVRFETKAGLVTIRFDRREGGTEAEVGAPMLPVAVPIGMERALAAAILGLSEESLDPSRPVAAFSCSVPFLFVALRDVDALGKAALDLTLWREHLSAGPVLHVYPFAEISAGGFRARMFAPASGIAEDPATGGAAVAFVGYLASVGAAGRRPDGSYTWRIDQGLEMGRPSTLMAHATFIDGKLARSSVSGAAVQVMEGIIRCNGNSRLVSPTGLQAAS